MSLPNPSMSFTPLDTLPASSLNDIVENIESLAAGTGLNDASIVASKLGTHIKKGVMATSVFTSTGNHSITGIGFKPVLVEFEILFSSSSSFFGVSTGSMASGGAQSWNAMSGKTTASFRNSSKTQCIAYLSGDDGSIAIQGSFVSMDADGFTFSTAIAGSSFEVAYKAYA